MVIRDITELKKAQIGADSLAASRESGQLGTGRRNREDSVVR